MNTCPCCSSPMLRHVRHNQIYWYCSSCHQEMPNINNLLQEGDIVNQSQLSSSHSSFTPIKRLQPMLLTAQ